MLGSRNFSKIPLLAKCVEEVGLQPVMSLLRLAGHDLAVLLQQGMDLLQRHF